MVSLKYTRFVFEFIIFKYIDSFLRYSNNTPAPIFISKNAIQNSEDGLLKNKTFLVTGKLNGISRAELKSLIEENSGKTVSSVSKKLNYLIIGDKPTKKKIENAKKLKINVIDQAEFMRMLNKTS